VGEVKAELKRKQMEEIISLGVATDRRKELTHDNFTILVSHQQLTLVNVPQTRLIEYLEPQLEDCLYAINTFLRDATQLSIERTTRPKQTDYSHPKTKVGNTLSPCRQQQEKLRRP
jgi:hypothetical protein